MDDERELWKDIPHWITQKYEDRDLFPIGCAFCGCRQLEPNQQGWICVSCDQPVHAVSYYRGVNAGTLKKQGGV